MESVSYACTKCLPLWRRDFTTVKLLFGEGLAYEARVWRFFLYWQKEVFSRFSIKKRKCFLPLKVNVSFREGSCTTINLCVSFLSFAIYFSKYSGVLILFISCIYLWILVYVHSYIYLCMLFDILSLKKVILIKPYSPTPSLGLPPKIHKYAYLSRKRPLHNPWIGFSKRPPLDEA